MAHNMSLWWSVPWVFTLGTQITLENCLPDVGADALFLMGFLCLLRGRQGLYVLLMSLCCLSREGYASIAGMVFLYYAVRYVKEGCFRENLGRLLLLALPGILITAWIGYVTLHFGRTPASQAHNILALPFKSAWHFFVLAVQSHNELEIAGKLIYFVTMVLSIGLCLMAGKRERLFGALIPYVFLLICFGPSVMENITGYPKGISVLFGVLPIALAFCDLPSLSVGRKVRAGVAVFLAAQLFWSVNGFLHKGIGYYPNTFANGSPQESVAAQAVSLVGRAEVLSATPNYFKMLPLQRYFFYTPSATVKVHLTNDSPDYWYANDNKEDQYGVYLQGAWLRNGELVKVNPLYRMSRNLAPGESLEMEMQVERPRQAGTYTYSVHLVQRLHDKSVEIGSRETTF